MNLKLTSIKSYGFKGEDFQSFSYLARQETLFKAIGTYVNAKLMAPMAGLFLALGK